MSFLEKGKSVSFHEEEPTEDGQVIDIIAQQMKFTACLKIMMEELSTLATGFESDGGLIRLVLFDSSSLNFITSKKFSYIHYKLLNLEIMMSRAM